MQDRRGYFEGGERDGKLRRRGRDVRMLSIIVAADDDVFVVLLMVAVSVATPGDA